MAQTDRFMGFMRGLRDQLGKLQRLAQPYFLPFEESSSWAVFACWCCAADRCVGVTLLLLPGVVAGQRQPDSGVCANRFLPGVLNGSPRFWSGRVGSGDPLVPVWRPVCWRLAAKRGEGCARGRLAALAVDGGDRPASW